MKLPKLAHQGWGDCEAFKLLSQIAKQLMPGSYYPNPSEWTFRAFEMNPLDIKVVIMDESPYSGQYESGDPHTQGYALATSSPNYREWPLALRVIYQNILLTEDGYLDPSLKNWRDQGIFLLNASLTCIKNSEKSHEKLWLEFTRKLVDYISSLPGTRIWYFLGETDKFERQITPFKDVVFKTQHPALATFENAFDGQFKQVAQKSKEIHGIDLKYLHPR